MTHLILGYGTLLLKDSLNDTIGKDAVQKESCFPVTVPDYQRLFNLRPLHYESSQKIVKKDIENAAMNVKIKTGSHFNALAFTVSEEQLKKLDKREKYYERKLVPIHCFDTKSNLGQAYCYVSQSDAEWIEHDPEKLLPLWRDIVWGRVGAYRISKKFGIDFDNTTFLADGQTLVVTRYQDVLDDIEDVKIPD